ncbi:phosphohistidine phosphatase SixA [Desulfobacterales bacterium HSG17]|nr:phosphohistidine phosphatase SixA [Desulfobacterales bacterium HSG17]
MALFLVQHGISNPKEIDPNQGLSDKGFEKVKLIAKVAKNYNVRASCIHHSVKKRAKQTAEIFAESLNPSMGIIETQGLKPMDDPISFAENISVQDNLMLVGHLPFMEKMAAYLITGSIKKPVFKFQNSGIVCLDELPEPYLWVIKWAVMPEIG